MSVDNNSNLKFRTVRTSYIPPEDPFRRFERYANQTGKSPGPTGKVPPAGISPIPGVPQTPPAAISATKPVMRPVGQTSGNIVPAPGHTGQLPAAGVSPIPGAPQTPPSATLPKKPLIRPGGQTPGNSPPANQPTSSSSGHVRPTKPTGPGYGPAPAALVVPIEGKVRFC